MLVHRSGPFVSSADLLEYRDDRLSDNAYRGGYAIIWSGEGDKYGQLGGARSHKRNQHFLSSESEIGLCSETSQDVCPIPKDMKRAEWWNESVTPVSLTLFGDAYDI